jgi:hypothetical protein
MTGDNSVKPKIYCFINSAAHEWYVGVALAEDGDYLAGHISSSKNWSKHDMGITSEWKHDAYAKKYPEGYELEWVDCPKDHAGLLAACELNQGKATSDPEAERSEAESQ